MQCKLWISLGICALVVGCAPNANPEAEWNGTYIGYMHRNKQDTTLITLVFNGKYFAGSTPSQKKVEGHYAAKGPSQLLFDAQRHQVMDTGFSLNGMYHYEKAPDGSIRIWQQYGNVMEEFILRQLIQ